MKNIIPTPKQVADSIVIEFGSKPIIKVKKNIFIKLNGVWFFIPIGFISDGASLPWILTGLINRMDKKIILFSILHDYFYKTQFAPRFYADAVYEMGLEKTANKLISISFYIGLRLAGWYAWGKNKKKGVLHYPHAYDLLIEHICITERGTMT